MERNMFVRKMFVLHANNSHHSKNDNMLFIYSIIMDTSYDKMCSSLVSFVGDDEIKLSALL